MRANVPCYSYLLRVLLARINSPILKIYELNQPFYELLVKMLSLVALGVIAIAIASKTIDHGILSEASGLKVLPCFGRR